MLRKYTHTHSHSLTHTHCHGYDIKKSDGEALVMLELWEVRSTPSLPSLPFPLWLRMVAPESVLSMSQTEQFDILTECKQMTDV